MLNNINDKYHIPNNISKIHNFNIFENKSVRNFKKTLQKLKRY